MKLQLHSFAKQVPAPGSSACTRTQVLRASDGSPSPPASRDAQYLDNAEARLIEAQATRRSR